MELICKEFYDNSENANMGMETLLYMHTISLFAVVSAHA